MLGVFFVLPFAGIIAASFFHRVDGGFYTPAFELDNYGRLFDAFFTRVLGFSLWIAALGAALTLAIGFPFTYALTLLKREAQVPWLVLVLAVLSLSEVIIGFAWSSLLSRTAGLSNLLVMAGLLDTAQAWYPGFPALLIGLVYLGLPYSVLALYPAVSRLDRDVLDAAHTLGATPMRAFLRITLPLLRIPLLVTFIMLFVIDLGCYLLPQILGKPEHWTLSVLITDQALFQANVPFAAALAVALLATTAGLVALVSAIGRRGMAP